MPPPPEPGRSRRGPGGGGTISSDSSEPGAASAPWYSRGLSRTGSLEALPLGIPDEVGAGDRYERLSLLGEGGMGRVWLGHDRRLGRRVALKEPLGGPDGPHARALWHEAAITARLSHPAVVTVYDVLQGPEGPVFVMEQVEGEPLRALLATAAHDPEARSRLLRPFAVACAAVGEAHRMGIIHRDLSPGNLLVGEGGQAWVLDWGLALEGGAALPAGRGPAGTPGCIAPEVLGGGRPDTRSDVWSLGACLHRIVYGVPAGAPLGVAGGVSPELAAVVERAIHPEPARRYPDARALALDLERWLDGRRVEAYAFPIWKLAWRIVVQWRAPLAAAALALMAVIGSLAWSAHHSRRAEAVAERAREHAQEQERRARRALAEQLGERARDALGEGAVEEAEALARQALEHDELPRARGVLALAAAVPRVVWLERHEAAGCATWLPLPPWPDGLCLTDDAVSLHRGGIERWRVESELPEVRVAPWAGPGGGSLPAVHVLNGRRELLVVALEDGARLDADLEPSKFLDPEQALQALRFRPALRQAPPVDPGCEEPIEAARVLADGGVLTSCGAGGVWRHHPDGRREHAPWFAGEIPQGFAELSDGSVWVASATGRVAPLDASNVGFEPGEPLRAMLAWPGRPWLWLVGQTGTVRLLDTEHRSILVALPGRYERLVQDAPDPDGAPRFVALHRGRAHRFRLPAPLRRSASPPGLGLTSVVWARDGESVWAADGGGGALWVPLDRDAPVQRALVVRGVAKTVDVDPETGEAWVSGVHAEGLHRVVPGPGGLSPVLAHPGPPSVRRLVTLVGGWRAWLDYGPGILFGGPGGGLELTLPEHQLWDLRASAARRCLVGTGSVVVRACQRPDGAWIPERLEVAGADAGAITDEGRAVVAGADGLRILGEGGARWGHPVAALDLAWIGDDRVVTAGIDGWIRVFRAADGRLLAEWSAHTARAAGVDATPDGAWLASAGWDGRVRFARVDHALLGLER